MKLFFSTVAGISGLFASSMLSAQTPDPNFQQQLKEMNEAKENVQGYNKSGLAPTQSATGFIFFNGRVYIVSGNRAVLLTREFSFRVTPTGFIGFNGMAQSIPEGSMLSMNGQLMVAPSGLVDATGNPMALPALNAQTTGANGDITSSRKGDSNAQQGFINGTAGVQGPNANPNNAQNGTNSFPINQNGNFNGNTNTNGNQTVTGTKSASGTTVGTGGTKSATGGMSAGGKSAAGGTGAGAKVGTGGGRKP